MLVTGYQLTAARSLIGMSEIELARLSGVRLKTISMMESYRGGPIVATASDVTAVQNALDKAGVELLGEGRPGVRLKDIELHVHTPLVADEPLDASHVRLFCPDCNRNGVAVMTEAGMLRQPPTGFRAKYTSEKWLFFCLKCDAPAKAGF